MPLTAQGPRSWPKRNALALFIGLLPVVLGLFLLHWQAERALSDRAAQSADDAVRQVDLMLGNVERAAIELLPLAGQDCDQATFALREQVTLRPFVRSTNLVAHNILYCSSLFGNYNEPLNPADYVDGTLWLMNGNPVTPGSALLIYRLADGERSALVSIDGYHLSNVLSLIRRKTQLAFTAGNVWLSEEGKVQDSALPAYPVGQTTARSTLYPYSVQAGFPDGEAWRYMASDYSMFYGLLVFLGVLAGGSARWIQRRGSTPSHELQRALEAKEFIPYFQPVVRGDTGEWAGVEVLMRWKHPREGLVRPDLFIPFAEHSGLIVPMTRSLMEQVATLLAPHAERFSAGFHVALNISAGHCQDLTLVEDCRRLLAAFRPGHITLVLELTERELIVSSDVTHQLFQALHELGVMIAIDDFGTGHSSLNYLRTFNVDYLKIDQSFVATIGVDALSGHILDSIIELSAKLDLGIVAEGIETCEQRDYLANKKVDFLQGYLFGRPMPAEELFRAMPAFGQNHA